MTLDRDAALALEVHRVQRLLAHQPHVNRLGQLQDTIRQRGLAMIHMGDNAKIPDVFDALFHAAFISRSLSVLG